MNHTKKYHNVQESTMEFLQNRVNELEQLVSKLQQKETSVDNIDEKSMSEAGSENQMNIDEVQQVPDVESDHEMNIDEPVFFYHKQDKIGNILISTEKEVKIPAHLKSVNSNHLTLLKGYRMFSQSVGNGACGTNCGSMHMFEDNSEEAMIKMKRKINFHIAEHYDEIYANVIGLPYSESVFGEVDKQTCSTPEELKEFLRSDKALRVYSNFQEIQAMANIFNLAIEVFTYGTRTGLDGFNYQVAGWMETILPMAEAANLAEFSEGYFPSMALYHSNDNHFDLLMADTSRLVTDGLLGRCQPSQVQQVPFQTEKPMKETEVRPGSSRSHPSNVQQVFQAPTHVQEEGGWKTVPGKSAKAGPEQATGSWSKRGGQAGQEAAGRIMEGGNFLNYLCNGCEEIFKDQGILEKHMTTHEYIQSE